MRRLGAAAEVGDTPEEAAFRDEVRAFLAGRLAPRPPERRVVVLGSGNDDLEPGRRFLATLAERGLAVPRWPERFGGIGATPGQAAIVAAELGRFEAPDLYPFAVGTALVGPTVLDHGTEEQQERWLPPIRSGEEIWCQLFSEPDAGSDLAGLTCRAEPDGDGWRITGSKVWSSRAVYSQWGLLLARSDPSAAKHAGITAFGIDMRQPGVEVQPLVQMNGDRHFSQVFLDGAFVPDGDRIGDEGAGWGVATTTLMHERASIGGWGGVSPGDLVDRARRFGGAEEGARRARLASVVADMEVAHLSGLRARAAARSGRPPGPEGSGAKLRSSLVLRELAELGVDVAGPAGVAEPDDWSTLFLTAPSFGIRGGTDEIQRNILGERVLGLPREPKPPTS